MKPEKTLVIRINADLHRKSKLRACEKLVTLKTWIEELIRQELKNN